MRHLLLALVVAGLTAGPGREATPAARQRPGAPPARSRADSNEHALRALAADANGVPAEFAADALLRLAGSGRVADREWRLQLLDDAYMRAYGAQQQYRRSTTLQIPPDSRQGADKLAFDTALTRVSLQVRAVQLLLLDDPGRARELFEWIDLNLAAAVCTDPLVPAVDEYYTMLGRLAGAARGGPADGLMFLELYLWRAHLPSEMPAVARAIQRFNPGATERAYLEGRVRDIFEHASADARGFSSASLDTVSRFVDLQVADRGDGVPGWYLMDALRDYLETQMKRPRCADSASEPIAQSSFNALVRKLDAIVKPIDDVAVRPGRTLGAVTLEPYWTTPEAHRLYDQEFALRGPGRTPIPARQRQTSEWRNQAQQLLSNIEHWTGTREADRDYFYQKAVLFTGLIDLIPPDAALHERAVRAYVDFLRHAAVETTRRTLWFAMVERLLETARGGVRNEILTAMEDAHHPVLSLYAQLERMTGR